MKEKKHIPFKLMKMIKIHKIKIEVSVLKNEEEKNRNLS